MIEVKPSPEHFVSVLPPLHRWNGYIGIAETLRRDIKLAAADGVLPADARFWIRGLSHSPVITVELFAWPGNVLAADYVTAVMEGALVKRGLIKDAVMWPVRAPKELPQDTRLTSEVNEALALVKACADCRIIEATATRPRNYYGLIQYRVEIRSQRLIVAAERGLRIEVDPEYAEFMHRARCAAARLGRRVVRQLCGEGGVDFGDDAKLDELVMLDVEACGRPVAYSRQRGCWVVR